MKAWRLSAPAPIAQAPLRLEEVPRPEPRAGQVLIQVHCCGLCRTDLHVVEGELPVRREHVIPGHQIVGTVVSRGPAPENALGPPRAEAAAEFGAAPAPRLEAGARVGVAWLHGTDGTCRFCRSGRENLCPAAAFTGWTVDGGYAEYCLADARFVYPLPASFSDLEAAPLLCAGIIGYRALRLTALPNPCPGARLGIYGFGAAGHIVLQLARARGAEVYVCTRDGKHRELAAELGARWVGGAAEPPPAKLDAAILFAPAGELVPPALAALEAGGVLALGGIHMSPIPALDYSLLYRERVLRSVANNTRADGEEFLREAAAIPIRARVVPFPFAQANEALRALKEDAIEGAAVLRVRGAQGGGRPA